MPDVPLPGCRPEPLMSYLKTLGVFRLVAEQVDQTAALSWRSGVAHLTSRLDRDALTGFFLKDYRPTPTIAPWNGGSGFFDDGSADNTYNVASTPAKDFIAIEGHFGDVLTGPAASQVDLNLFSRVAVVPVKIHL